MKKIYLATAAVLLSVTSLAQNLNPEVEVTNEYEARISESTVRRSIKMYF